MNLPLVTIYIPTRNRPDLLSRALKSCIQQTYKALEIIVVDDASEQIYQEDIEAAVRLDPRIKLIRQPQRLGACAARNRAIFAAEGFFVSGLDDDDEFMPERIASFVQFWSEHQCYGFLCSGYEVITKRLRYRYARKATDICLQKLLLANCVGNQIFTTTERLKSIAGFDPALPSYQDYDAWLRLTEHFGAGYRLSEQSYIVHQEHQRPRISASDALAAGYRMFLKKHGHRMSPAQLRSQQFYFELNSERWSSLGLLRVSDCSTVGVALKNIIIRQFGRFRGRDQ